MIYSIENYLCWCKENKLKANRYENLKEFSRLYR